MWNPPNDDFFETVWLIVKQIPEGVVSSYGQIATMIPPMPEVTP
ncbi:MAG: MGMT family protein, partial [Anaerolineae bacterium]|nr:MGMT family protein [Anaerolineae bacterium]